MKAEKTVKTEKIEIAYQVAGESWKCCTFKTQAACDKFLDKLDDKYGLACVEIRWAN